MVRSMVAGVSGLRTHQSKLDVIGNNIANVLVQVRFRHHLDKVRCHHLETVWTV